MPKRLIAPIYTMFSLGTMMAIAHMSKPTQVNHNNISVKSYKQSDYMLKIRRV